MERLSGGSIIRRANSNGFIEDCWVIETAEGS
jgi:hypothetical protein